MAANITVLYGGEPAEFAALDFTAMLATGLDARAECRFARDPLAALTLDQRSDYRNLIEMSGWGQAHTYLVETSQVKVRELSATAAERFRRLPASAHLAWERPLDLSDNAGTALTALGFTRDLLVASFNLNDGVRAALLQRVLLAAGAPVALVAHPTAARRLEDSTLVVAWKPSAAAKHALRYALPLMRKARQVHLVAIEEDAAPKTVPSAQEIADYLLEVHSVTVQASGLRAADSPPLQLAEFYREMGADLLVMGAYSTSRLQEMWFGGFTKHFLTRPTCNLLLAH
jgi:nucleotide-binding universal stress UspA family protein